MSHTYIWRSVNSDEEVAFNLNSDLSGEVRIVNLVDGGVGDSIKIPGEALLYFAARFVRNSKMSNLERMSDREVLGLDKF